MDKITRENVDKLLDQGRIGAVMNTGKVWKARRNGKTKLWKRDPERICIPFKVGFKEYGQITERHFIDGVLSEHYFRLL